MIPLPDPARLALFLDFDGTLVEIAARPQDVVVDPALVSRLRALDQLLEGAVALVSGRKIDEIDAHLAPLKLRCAGVHGAEQRFQVDGFVERSEADEISPLLLAELQRLVTAFPNVTVENKRFACAVHFRANPAVGPALGEAMARLVADKPDISLMPGHCIFEIKTLQHTKATAIAAFMRTEPFAGRVPVFIGDDVTDSFGFEAVRAMGGLAYSVGREMDDVDGWFMTPGAVRTWLKGIVGTAPVEP